MFTKHMSDKGLVSKTIHTELSELNNKEMNSQIAKWAKDLNRHLFKEEIQMVSNHMKRCLTSYVVRRL